MRILIKILYILTWWDEQKTTKFHQSIKKNNKRKIIHEKIQKNLSLSLSLLAAFPFLLVKHQAFGSGIDDLTDATGALSVVAPAPAPVGYDLDAEREALLAEFQILAPIQETIKTLSLPALQFVRAMFDGVASEADKGYIVDVLSGYSTAEMEKAAHGRVFLEGITNKDHKVDIFTALYLYSPARIDEIIADGAPFFEGITNGQQRAGMIISLCDSTTPIADMVPYGTIFLEGVADNFQRAIIVKAIAACSLEKLHDMVAHGGIFFDGITDGKARADMIGALGSNKASIEQMLPYLNIFLEGIDHPEERATISRFFVSRLDLSQMASRSLEVVPGMTFAQKLAIIKRLDLHPDPAQAARVAEILGAGFMQRFGGK